LLRPKPNIEKLTPGTHGGIDRAEIDRLGIPREDILDFSVSTNPFGPPPGIEEALSSASIEHYPDSESTELTQALASKLNVSPSNLIIGSGSTELIRLAATAYFAAGDSVLIPEPTYGEYELACRLVGAGVLRQPAPEETGFRLDAAETARLIEKHRPRGIFLGNPNNPTGQFLTKDEVTEILSRAEENLVILDEAYIAFTRNAWNSLDMISNGNLMVLRSMTKDYALAGLRLGYAVAAGPVVSALKRVRPPWNVGSVAQKAGVFALKADAYLKSCTQKIEEAKGFLTKELKNLGLRPLPSETNFFMVRVGNAAQFRQILLKKGILVRDCTSFGLPQYIRLAPRTIAECQRLIEAIKESGAYHHDG